MDRNSIIGIVLIGSILALFYWINQPNQSQIEQAKRYQDSTQQVEIAHQAEMAELAKTTKDAVVTPQLTDSAKLAIEQNKFGVFATAAAGTSQFVTIENKLVKITLASLGGRIYSVELKDYQTFDDQPVVLFNGDDNKFGFNLIHHNRINNTNDLYFEIAKKDAKSAELRLKASDNEYLSYQYNLPEDSYMVDFNIVSNQMGEVLGRSQNVLDLTWTLAMPKQEKGKAFEIQHSGVYYKYFQDEVDYISGKEATTEMRTKVRWVGMKDQFFSSVFIAEKPFNSGTVKSTSIEDETIPYIRNNSADLSVPIDLTDGTVNKFNFYFGPNHYYTLQKYGKELELNKLIHLGWGFLGWINRFVVIPIFNWLELFIGSYGIIILILTLIIKLVLFPLTYKSYISTAKMRVLKPQIDEINERIPKDKAMERQQATMNLYRKAGVNPLGGCLPMVLQMPILIALFSFFPASIELRHQSFLWATDLSSYDSIFSLPFTIPFYGNHVSLFCLLMSITNVVYTWMNQEMTQSSQQMPGMKTMMYLMPVMFLFFFNNYASGLSYYYFISTLMTIGQTLLIRRFVDEKALLAKIHANQKKVTPKSKFQQRLEEMSKKQNQLGKGKR